MRCALLVLSVAIVLSSSQAFADEPSGTVPAAPGTGGDSSAAVAPKRTDGLSRIHGAINAEGNRSAGTSRDVGVTTNANARPTRPPPTVRMLRRLEVERFVTSIDPSVRACASENASIYAANFALAVSVAPSGAVEGAEVTSSNARVAPPVLACVMKAVSAARFGAPGASGALVTIPLTVPGRALPPRTVTSVTVTKTSPPAPDAASTAPATTEAPADSKPAEAATAAK
jgi:hypothetical protein